MSIAQRFHMHESRLGDEIDDFCIKCKRLTNHAIVSLLDGNAAKVRCKTCYHDHDFRNCVPVPTKKELKKAADAAAALANGEVPVEAVEVEVVAEVVADKKGKKTAKG